MVASNSESNVRKLFYLKWINALNSGYGMYNETIQPATLSNLAGHITRTNAMPTYFEERYDELDLREPIDKDVYTSVKRHAQNCLRIYYGSAYVSKGTTEKTEENHLLLRDGPEQLPLQELTKYTVTRNGHQIIEYLLDEFQSRRSTRGDVDVIKFPIEGDFGKWELRELTIPKEPS